MLLSSCNTKSTQRGDSRVLGRTDYLTGRLTVEKPKIRSFTYLAAISMTQLDLTLTG